MVGQMEDVVTFITLCEGTVYGEYPRDVLCGDTPRRIDAYFQFNADYDMFVGMCPMDMIFQASDGFFCRTETGVYITCTIGVGFPDFDFECDTLTITYGGISSLMAPGDLRTLGRIMDDIRNKVAREVNVNARSRVDMWTRGWKVVGEHLAASKIQAQFRKAMAVPDYKMCRDRVLRDYDSCL